MLLLHSASAGHGLNLQGGGNIIIIFAIPWSFDQNEQVIARIAGGLRRTRPTFVYRLIMTGTIDERLRETVETNRSVQDVLKDEVKRRRDKRRIPDKMSDAEFLQAAAVHDALAMFNHTGGGR